MTTNYPPAILDAVQRNDWNTFAALLVNDRYTHKLSVWWGLRAGLCDENIGTNTEPLHASRLDKQLYEANRGR